MLRALAFLLVLGACAFPTARAETACVAVFECNSEEYKDAFLFANAEGIARMMARTNGEFVALLESDHPAIRMSAVRRDCTSVPRRPSERGNGNHIGDGPADASRCGRKASP